MIRCRRRWRVRLYRRFTLPLRFRRRRHAVLLAVALARLSGVRVYVHGRDGTVEGVLS